MSEPRDAPKGAVVVVGSANVDLVMNPRDLPSPGVTVLAPSYKLLPGGKGANQAYACAKLGCESVRFIGATGDDDFSKLVLGNLEAAGVDVTGVAKRADHPTACASVVVDARGENQICVGSGANAAVDADQLDGRIARGDVLLMQMEVPTPTLEACVAKAKACGAAVAVNVAPSANASAVGVDVYRAVDFLIVNQHELKDVCDAVGAHHPTASPPTSSAAADLAVFVARTTETIVVVTLGAAGAEALPPAAAARRAGAGRPRGRTGNGRHRGGRRAVAGRGGDRGHGGRRGRVRRGVRRARGSRGFVDSMRRRRRRSGDDGVHAGGGAGRDARGGGRRGEE